jgi:hypothetical protein
MRVGAVSFALLAAAISAAFAPGSGWIREASGAECETSEIEYLLSGNLRITETHFGAGDGDYRVGPGRIVLQVDRSSPSPDGPL